MPQFNAVLSKLAQDRFDEVFESNHKIAKQIGKAIDRLCAHPDIGEFLKGEWSGYRKYRTGDYRIIYRVENERLIIYILTIGNRKNVYED